MLFEVEDLRVQVRRPGKDASWVDGVHGASFGVEAGEVLALVGESGAGKSLMVMGAVDLLPAGARVSAGTTRYKGRELRKISDDEWRTLVGMGIGLLFQDPIGGWDPTQFLGDQSGEALAEHTDLSRDEIAARVEDALGEVRLPHRRRFFRSFAYEMSRGEAQRAMLATALLSDPDLLIADEPLSGLDPTVARAVLDIIETLRARRNMAMILLTHDLGVVAAVADRVAVVYGGRVVEVAEVDDLYHRPQHPYTAGLLASLPALGRRLQPIEGDPLDITEAPDACAFADRCPYAASICYEGVPELRPVATSQVRCVRAEELELEGVGS